MSRTLLYVNNILMKESEYIDFSIKKEKKKSTPMPDTFGRLIKRTALLLNEDL